MAAVCRLGLTEKTCLCCHLTRSDDVLVHGSSNNEGTNIYPERFSGIDSYDEEDMHNGADPHVN